MEFSSQRLRTLSLYVALYLIAFLSAVLVVEVQHRYLLTKKIANIVKSTPLWIQNHTLIRGVVDDFFDRKTEEHPKGLFLINTTFDIAVAHPTNGTLNFSVRTNNVGLLSDKTYQIARDPQYPEYRIVMLGDSMTGPTTSTYQWVDTVEDLLNTSSHLQKHVGGKQFRVYNLGWVGAGFKTFWQAYEKSGQYFSPDMVIVNFLELDFPRASDNVHFQSENEMIESAKGYIGKLLVANPNLLVTLMPTYADIIPSFPAYKLTPKLVQAEPRIRIEIMRDRLPTHLGLPEMENWFNVPHDAHYSDRGGEIYARTMAGLIAERITGTKMDFSETPSKYSSEVLGPNKPRLRKIVNSLSPLADAPAKVAEIKNYIHKEMIKGKVYSFYLYSLN